LALKEADLRENAIYVSPAAASVKGEERLSSVHTSVLLRGERPSYALMKSDN